MRHIFPTWDGFLCLGAWPSAKLDGDPVVVILQRGADTWTPHSVIRMEIAGHQIQQIVNYLHCPWVLPDATIVTVSEIHG